MNVDNEKWAVQLRERYAAAIKGQPSARIRNVAERLGVSELELVAAGAGGLQARPLRAPPQTIFRELGSLGRVMALTRNDWCVHERHGCYQDVRAGQTMGIVLGPDIDLRLFFSHWGQVWAVDGPGRKSLQFFDVAGGALHKVYMTPESDAAAWQAIIDRHSQADFAWPELKALPADQPQGRTVAPSGLRQDWLAMQDTHDFLPLLKRHEVDRLTALRDVGPDLAQRVEVGIAERMLVAVAERDISLMCFVGNRGIIQIHSGPVQSLRRTGPWFNVLEPHFNLHLNTHAIHSAWVVNKPTTDGWVTSLECFSKTGEMIVQFFGARKPGQPELVQWRALLESFCPIPLAA